MLSGMKKKLVPLLAAALLLSGCASTAATDDTFISDVESYVGSASGHLSDQSRASLIEIAHAVCSGLDDGKSTSEVESVITKLGIDSDYAGQVVSAAITNYCPR